jgi:putative drug exporter of the RND superfamily
MKHTRLWEIGGFISGAVLILFGAVALYLGINGYQTFAAAAVMVAVFFTFALSGPLPHKEMGVILGVAVLLDAMLVRLILIPTLLRVFGHTAWASPRWLSRSCPT